jgi:hypothetical protein
MDLATKDDFLALENKLLNLLQLAVPQTKIPKVIHSEKVMELLGGVSDNYIKELRLKGILNPKKVGGKWLYNLNEVISILPPDPETKPQ